MNKITIIGSGSVGSTIAYTLTVANIATEIIMIDINGDKKYYLTYKTFKGEDPVVALSIETLWDGSTYSLIKRDKSQPVLFRDFPLIGSEEFYFPYMLNGFDFEPTETRSGVLLNSNQPKPQKNRSIIENAVEAVINFND